MEQVPQKKPLISKDRQQLKQDRSAIRSDYQKWKGSLSYNDLVDFAKKCYNEYNDLSRSLDLPKDVRLAYLDQATSFKKLLDYIDRQA